MPIMNRKAISEPSYSLDRERGFVGLVKDRRAGHVNEFDWNSLLLGKKVSSEQEITDADVEAPRNSLESSPGTRTPRLSGVRHDDIPYAVEITKPIPAQYRRSEEILFSRTGELGKKKVASGEVLPIKTLIAQDSSDAELEKRRRSAPSVVARLMGLDTLPDKLSRGSPTKPPKPTKSSNGSAKDTKPHSARPETCSRMPSPLHDLETIKDFPLPTSRARTDADVCEEEKNDFDVLPFRSHPQERQLQEFKKEFMQKLASQRYGPAAAGARDRGEVGTQRRQLREKLGEVRQALASGGDESRRLSFAQEKLLESKEFQDAIELLQTNKEFFRKFFPESKSIFTGGNKDPPEPECRTRRSFHMGASNTQPVKHEETSRRSFHSGDFSKESRKSSLLEDPSKESSRRSFHLDELTESGKSFSHHPQESSGRRSFHLEDHSSRESRRSHRFVDDVTKEIRAHEDYSDWRHQGDHHQNISTHPTSEHRKRRERRHKSPGANPVAEEVVILQRSSSKGNRDREGASWGSSPDDHSGRCGSPNRIVDSRKGGDSPSRIVLLKPGPGEITLLSPVMDPSSSPHTYRVVRDSQGDLFEAREIILLDPMQRFSPPRTVEEPRYPREEYRDPRVDPRAIARDIVREARTNSTRELSRDRETGRESPRPGHVNHTGLNGIAKRGSLPKYGPGLMESMEERISESDDTMGSFTWAALSKRQAMEENSRGVSPTVPIYSPRSRSQEPPLDKFHHNNSKSLKFLEKPKAIYGVEQHEEQQRKGPTMVRKTMGQAAHELNRMSRPRLYLPGRRSPASMGRGDPFQEPNIRADGWRGTDVHMYTAVPSTERVLKVEAMYPSNHHQNGGNDSQENSPRTVFRTIPRSIPNAGAMVGTKIRAEVPIRGGNNGAEKMETAEHFYLKEKRAEARQAFLLSRKKAVAPVSHQPRPVDNNAVQDIHCDVKPVQSHNLCAMARSSFEKSVPVEGGPREAACEQDLNGALSQRTPQTPPDATAHSETDESRQLSNHKQLEVPVDQQESKSSKAWSIATETFENGDGDGASETSVDKCGQPSPVSVLDSPFEAEISSPVEFKELSSDIQDLRYRLRLLKLDGTERSTALSESSEAEEKLIPQDVVVRHTANSLESTESISSSFNSTTFSVYRDPESQAQLSQALLFQAENIDRLQGLHCPEGRREELLYVRNILVASGFTNSGPLIIGKWHSPTCPLDPTLYERLEDSYVDANLQVGNIKSNSCTQGSYDSSSRRLLFDVVNEVLLQLLGPYLSSQPWIRFSTPLLRPIPTDWELVTATWSEICSYFYPEGVEEFEGLDCLMGRDVSKRLPWMDPLSVYEQIGLELERIIFESLIEETVHSFAPLMLLQK